MENRGKPWKNHGNYGKSMENPEKPRKTKEISGKTMENHGKPRKTLEFGKTKPEVLTALVHQTGFGALEPRFPDSACPPNRIWEMYLGIGGQGLSKVEMPWISLVVLGCAVVVLGFLTGIVKINMVVDMGREVCYNSIMEYKCRDCGFEKREKEPRQCPRCWSRNLEISKKPGVSLLEVVERPVLVRKEYPYGGYYVEVEKRKVLRRRFYGGGDSGVISPELIAEIRSQVLEEIRRGEGFEV